MVALGALVLAGRARRGQALLDARRPGRRAQPRLASALGRRRGRLGRPPQLALDEPPQPLVGRGLGRLHRAPAARQRRRHVRDDRPARAPRLPAGGPGALAAVPRALRARAAGRDPGGDRARGRRRLRGGRHAPARHASARPRSRWWPGVGAFALHNQIDWEWKQTRADACSRTRSPCWSRAPAGGAVARAAPPQRRRRGGGGVRARDRPARRCPCSATARSTAPSGSRGRAASTRRASRPTSPPRSTAPRSTPSSSAPACCRSSTARRTRAAPSTDALVARAQGRRRPGSTLAGYQRWCWNDPAWKASLARARALSGHDNVFDGSDEDVIAASDACTVGAPRYVPRMTISLALPACDGRDAVERRHELHVADDLGELARGRAVALGVLDDRGQAALLRVADVGDRIAGALQRRGQPMREAGDAVRVEHHHGDLRVRRDRLGRPVLLGLRRRAARGGFLTAGFTGTAALPVRS